ncbi:MAG: 50S ribosomal protein L18 [Thermoprotei archaeon]|nr:MAG: 50S ribosomal protein L18 [Thermoprotei archaeon]
MAKGGRYRLPLKRRRKGLTNYYKRRKLILSEKPRLVVRKTSRNIIAQIIGVKPEGDITHVSACSGELRKYGWKGGSKNTPAAYLVGYLVGLKALEKGIKEAVLDIGLHRPTKGAKVFAAAQGAIDAGLKIPIGKEILPDDKRVKGEHIANYAKLLKEKGEEAFLKQFSDYLKRGLDPETLLGHFEEIKSSIEKHLRSP